jgi:MoaA/NifB/PqqE/SkfB family radical SAM enzyme
VADLHTSRRGPRALPHRTTLQRINAELALASLGRGEAVAQHRPLHVAVQVASACNLDCYMCLEHSRPPEMRHGKGLKSFAPELFDVLAEEVLPYSSRLSFGIGGEPTLADNFEAFLERGFALGQETELLTNGTRLNHGSLAETVARCVAYLQISIDGATAATYERIRKGAKLARVIGNIELVNRHREAHAPDERTHLSFWFTIMHSNVHELPALVELAKRLHVDRVHAHHVTPITPEGAADSLLEFPALWNRWRAETIATARRLDVEIDVPVALPENAACRPSCAGGDGDGHAAANTLVAIARAGAGESRASFERSDAASESSARVEAGDPRADIRAHDLRYSRLGRHAVKCHLPSTAVYVLWDGRVVPCCYPYAQEKMTMGQLGQETFSAIWNGPLYRSLRAGMKSGDVLSICRHCPVVHDVPITPDEEAKMRASPTLAEWVAKRPEAHADVAPSMTVLADMRDAAALAETDDLRRHAHNLEAERPHLSGHIRNLESERPHLIGHIANLERERPHLVEHIAKLERELAETRAALARRGLKRWWKPKKPS